MAMRVKIEGQCCTDCLFYLANGDGDEAHAARVAATLGADAMHASVTCDNECPHGASCDEFSRRPCEACGTTLAGERHAFVVLEEGEEAPAESGYTDCACRDCFDVAVSGDMASPNLCQDCAEAGCSGAGDAECSRADAYDVDSTCEHLSWLCDVAGCKNNPKTGVQS